MSEEARWYELWVAGDGLSDGYGGVARFASLRHVQHEIADIEHYTEEGYDPFAELTLVEVIERRRELASGERLRQLLAGKTRKWWKR